MTTTAPQTAADKLAADQDLINILRVSRNAMSEHLRQVNKAITLSLSEIADIFDAIPPDEWNLGANDRIPEVCQHLLSIVQQRVMTDSSVVRYCKLLDLAVVFEVAPGVYIEKVYPNEGWCISRGTESETAWTHDAGWQVVSYAERARFTFPSVEQAFACVEQHPEVLDTAAGDSAQVRARYGKKPVDNVQQVG